MILSVFADLKKLYPVVEPNLSDSGSADCCLEFLAMASPRSLPEVRVLAESFKLKADSLVFLPTGCHDDGSRSLAQR
jgi:hypothetical protein